MEFSIELTNQCCWNSSRRRRSTVQNTIACSLLVASYICFGWTRVPRLGHRHKHWPAPTHTHTRTTRSHTHTHITDLTLTYTYMGHTFTHTHTRAYTHTHTHTHTHVHMHMHLLFWQTQFENEHIWEMKFGPSNLGGLVESSLRRHL